MLVKVDRTDWSVGSKGTAETHEVICERVRDRAEVDDPGGWHVQGCKTEDVRFDLCKPIWTEPFQTRDAVGEPAVVEASSRGMSLRLVATMTFPQLS